MDIKSDIAAEALSIVNGERRAAYGAPERNFERIKLLQGAYLGCRAGGHGAPLSELDVAMMNLLQKVARIAESPTHRDSYVDIIGYALCGAEVAGVGLKDAAPRSDTDRRRCEAACTEPQTFRVGDRVRVRPAGLNGVPGAAGKEALIKEETFPDRWELEFGQEVSNCSGVSGCIWYADSHEITHLN